MGPLLLLSLTASSGAAAADVVADFEQPQARLSWHLGFGGSARHAPLSCSLALGYRSDLDDSPATRLLEMRLSDTESSVGIAGLPLWSRRHSLQQSADVNGHAATGPAQPWYARRWVLWTAAGIAAAAALASSDAEVCINCQDGDDQPRSGGGILCGGNTGPVEHPDDCTVPTDPG